MTVVPEGGPKKSPDKPNSTTGEKPENNSNTAKTPKKPTSREFLEENDPYIVDAALKKKKSSPDFENLTDDEIVALHAYTGKYYRKINPRLRGDKSIDANWDTVADDANSALEKLGRVEGRTHQGTTFRGIEQMSDADVNKLFNVGEDFSDPAFMSSSPVETNAFKGDVKLTIDSKTSVKVDDLSAIPQETEVLFKPNSKFNVIDKLQDENGVWQITMREKP